jgi:hypothetical protein
MEEHPARFRIDANNNEVGGGRCIHSRQNCASGRDPVALAALESANPVVGACPAKVSEILEKDDGYFPIFAYYVPGNPPALYDILPFKPEGILRRVVNAL